MEKKDYKETRRNGYERGKYEINPKGRVGWDKGTSESWKRLIGGKRGISEKERWCSWWIWYDECVKSDEEKGMGGGGKKYSRNKEWNFNQKDMDRLRFYSL